MSKPTSEPRTGDTVMWGTMPAQIIKVRGRLVWVRTEDGQDRMTSLAVLMAGQKIPKNDEG